MIIVKEGALSKISDRGKNKRTPAGEKKISRAGNSDSQLCEILQYERPDSFTPS
jgi:hypothetical protein